MFQPQTTIAWGGALLWLLGIAAALLARLVSRIPAAHASAGVSGVATAWEGVAYGTAERLLLSVLPVVVTWQLFGALGWTSGWHAVVAAAAALAASAGVIVVHHLGYREFRGPALSSPLVRSMPLRLPYL